MYPEPKKTLRYAHKIVCYLPSAWLLLFITFVLRAYLALGHMPRYNQPDPKDLSFDLHHTLVFFMLPAVLISLPVWIITTVITVWAKQHHFRDSTLFIATYLLLIFSCRHNVLHLFEWLMD